MTNVFCILISILKYKIHDKSISNTKYKILFSNVFQIKYKIHAKYFKYVFQIHVFQILPNTGYDKYISLWKREIFQKIPEGQNFAIIEGREE